MSPAVRAHNWRVRILSSLLITFRALKLHGWIAW